MAKRKLIIFTILLILFTVIAAYVHLSTRDNVGEGTLLISDGETNYTLDISEFDYEQISGTRLNGKGESIAVDAPGILLKNVLAGENIQVSETVIAVADDSYQAEISVDELNEPSKVYLLVQEEGGLRLIVFGDKNSKRSVSDLKQIIVR